MKPIPEIVKDHVLKNNGRMPETEDEIDEYLDLINHANEYAEAWKLEQLIGARMMKKLGYKTPMEIKLGYKNK